MSDKLFFSKRLFLLSASYMTINNNDMLSSHPVFYNDFVSP